MGTRADFYIGRGKDAVWLGSVAYDGSPDGILRESYANDAPLSAIGKATDDAAFAAAVVARIQARSDGTMPDQGWPWPWEDSRTTDYAYAWDGAGYCSCFGRAWLTFEQALDDDHERTAIKKTAVFPDMTDRQKVTFGERSGVLILGLK